MSPTEPSLATLNIPVRQIELRNVRVHNLKNIDLDIPLNQFVVITGVSGSGKTSLAFDTLLAEGQRRYIESFSTSARRHLERIERPAADRIAHVPVAIPVRSDRRRFGRTDARATFALIADLTDGLSLLYARIGRIICPGCEQEIQVSSPTDVATMVATLAAGTRCQIGFVPPKEAHNDTAKSWLARGFSRVIWDGVTHDLGVSTTWPKSAKKRVVADRFVAGKTQVDRIIESAESAFREGEGRCWLLVEIEASSPDEAEVVDGRRWRAVTFNRRLECRNCNRDFLPLEPRLFNPMATGACPTCQGTGRLDAAEGSLPARCPACGGSRLRDEARAVRVGNRFLAQLFRMTPDLVLQFMNELSETLTPEELRATSHVRSDLVHRLSGLCELGLNYLTLDRSADSLSSGELCRTTLAAVIGSRLTGTLVVVDEPSAGLTVGEMPLVVMALRKLQVLHNSVIAVDHAELIVTAADHVIELGPGAGPEGGSIVQQGPVAHVLQLKDEPTQNERRGNLKSVSIDDATPRGTRKKKPDSARSTIRLSNVEHHNFHRFAVEFPLRQLCVVTGPSGCGKTSLVAQVLYPAVCQRLGQKCDLFPRGQCELMGGDNLAAIAMIDQSPLTRSSRSNPATWLNVFDEIRQTFASTKEARQRGYTAQQFSFNSAKGGRCRSCLGNGTLRLDMQFLPDVAMKCPECHGTRYRPEILEVEYRGRSIADVLAMSISEAAGFFRSQPRIQGRVQFLQQIGLDYLVLGQPSDSLSGGEAQRLKLASCLNVPHSGESLIICDEPTVGLHERDIERLLVCFRELVASGHSLVIAETSSTLIQAADFVLDLGTFRGTA